MPQALVRGALAALLNLEPDLEVVVEVDRGDEVIDAVRRHRVDVALLDIEMPGMNGIEVTSQLAAEAPSVRSLIVTTFGRPGYLRRAIDAGAAGFVVKDTPASELADAVRRVGAGLRVVDPQVATESLIEGMNPLNDREQDTYWPGPCRGLRWPTSPGTSACRPEPLATTCRPRRARPRPVPAPRPP